MLYFCFFFSINLRQASEQYWEHFSKETLEECERCRQKSFTLRQTLNSILMNAARDLRSQADVVEKAFVVRINCTQENLQRFENDLRDVKRIHAVFCSSNLSIIFFSFVGPTKTCRYRDTYRQATSCHTQFRCWYESGPNSHG